MKGFGLSDVGKKRLVNQDSFYGKELSDDCFYAVVCDGMGGAAGGGVASSIAKDVYCTELEKRLKLYFETKEGSAATVLPRMMRESVQVCNSFTYELSEGDRSLKGMGTTLVSALVYKSQIFLCNVGDSRAYGFSEQKSVQLTKDHSFVQELIDCGKMTEKEAKKSTQKNIITRAIGVGKTVKPDSFVFERKDFRYLMLCTDGLSNDLEKKDLHRILFEPEEILSFEKKVQFMVSLANERSGKDNITAYLIAL